MLDGMSISAIPAPYPLRSPGGLSTVTLQGEELMDADGVRVGCLRGSVWSFLERPDAFYEGRFNNRVNYQPRGESWLATLPLRIVMQNYPTTVAAEVPRGSRVVEIGCAGGLSWFGQRYEMIGMDLSEKALRLAAANYELTLQCDATSMPLADASVDAVISSCLFEHLTDYQKAELLSEAVRVLKPRGKLVFLYDLWTHNTLISKYRRADPDRYKRLFLDGDGHLGYQSIEANRGFFCDAGLMICREIFNERTPLLSNSVWQKFSMWPGAMGSVGRMGARLSRGALRVPMQALVWATDATLGRLFPPNHARCMITVAIKP